MTRVFGTVYFHLSDKTIFTVKLYSSEVRKKFETDLYTAPGQTSVVEDYVTTIIPHDKIIKVEIDRREFDE